MPRKKRSDRNHIVYRLTCDSTGDEYIGITVADGRAYWQSVRIRFSKHVHRALKEERELPLCECIRQYGAEDFYMEILNIVRGKEVAHQLEKEYIEELEPSLNVLLSSNR